MGMALRGVTHCYRCGTTLADDEFCMCKNCKRTEKEEEEKEMMFLESDLLEDYKEEKEKKTKKNRKEEKIKELIKEVIEEMALCKEQKADIKRIGHLSLGYKTFVAREAKEDEIEICEWDKNFSNKWTVASFEYDDEHNRYIMVNKVSYLKNLEYTAFGELVMKGFEILGDFID